MLLFVAMMDMQNGLNEASRAVTHCSPCSQSVCFVHDGVTSSLHLQFTRPAQRPKPSAGCVHLLGCLHSQSNAQPSSVSRVPVTGVRTRCPTTSYRRLDKVSNNAFDAHVFRKFTTGGLPSSSGSRVIQLSPAGQSVPVEHVWRFSTFGKQKHRRPRRLRQSVSADISTPPGVWET